MIVRCDTTHYATFLLYLGLLVLFGFVLGHISHSSRKLFKILNKMYIYLVLPCICIYCVIAIRFSNWESHLLKGSLLVADLVLKGAFWFAIVIGALVIFRDRTVLKGAAITAQFVIHGNDIGFSKALLDSSCYIFPDNTTAGSNTDQDGISIDFSSIELSTNAMCFLIFLPLTHGLVTMSENSDFGLRPFVAYAVQQGIKMSFSYICLIVGIAIAYLIPADADFGGEYAHYFDAGSKMISCSGTLQSLLVGIYIYYLLMNCNWGHISAKKTIALSVTVTIVYPTIYYILIYSTLKVLPIFTKKDGLTNTEEVIVVAHAATPASIYLQYYILKHMRRPTNFIVAFLVSTFLGSIIMYTIIMDFEVLDVINPNNTKIYISPTDYYTETQRIDFLIMSIVVSSIAILMYARDKQSDLRMMIFILISCELVSNFIMACIVNLKLIDYPVGLPLFVSGYLMSSHIFNALMIAMMSLYRYFPTLIKRKWQLFVVYIAMISITIPTLLYAAVWIHFKDLSQYTNPELVYRYKNIDYFLDIAKKGIVDDQAVYPISAIAYTCINVTILIVYAVVFILRRREPPEDELLLAEVHEDDREKFVPCKLLAYYELSIIVLSLAFGIRNINYRAVRNATGGNVFSDYIMEEIELCSMILRDIVGGFATVLFCISPGAMDKECDRFMFIPNYFKSLCMDCTHSGTVPAHVENLNIEDLDRCRRFILYHKPAFISIYPPAVRNDMVTFVGRDLVDFLIDTTVADSLGEAVDVANSYLKGNVFTVEETIFRRTDGVKFREDDTTYVFTPDEILPCYQDILNQYEQPFIYLD